MANTYIITLADTKQIPALFKDTYLKGHPEPRIAFVGRSNVGKSSLLNAIMQERIARVSATPGKTRAIHFFKWGAGKKILVDLPGYGFAKRSKAEQAEWSKVLTPYFKADTGLERVLLLWDSRVGPTQDDLDALRFFIKMGAAIQIVMTKFDQLKNQSERAKRKKELNEKLDELGLEVDPFWVSSKELKTLDELIEDLMS